MQKGFWIALIGIVVILGGVFALTSKKEGSSDNPYLYGKSLEVQAHDHVEGSGKAVLIEYGDFECPACGGYFPILEELKASEGKNMTFVFRHFPIPNSHPNAMAAHRAAEAAGKQGKFFEMHDLLYQTQNGQWSAASTGNTNPAPLFESFAQQLGLNMDQYRTDIASQEIFDQIEADQSSGRENGVSATPTFFLNGTLLDQAPRDVEGWRKLIREAAGVSETTQPEPDTQPE